MGVKAAASTMVQYAHDANVLLDQIAERSGSDHKIYIESHAKGQSFSVYWAYKDHGHPEKIHGYTIYKKDRRFGKIS